MSNDMMTEQKVSARPIDDRVLVRLMHTEDVTPGGIALPEDARSGPLKGTVICVGSGRLLNDGSRSAMETREGDTVMFSRHTGTEVEINGEQYLVMSESQIMLVLDC